MNLRVNFILSLSLSFVIFIFAISCGGSSASELTCKNIEGTPSKPIKQECTDADGKTKYDVLFIYDDEGKLVQKEKYIQSNSELIEIEWYLDGKLYSKRYYEGEGTIIVKIEYFDSEGKVKETLDLSSKQG